MPPFSEPLFPEAFPEVEPDMSSLKVTLKGDEADKFEMHIVSSLGNVLNLSTSDNETLAEDTISVDSTNLD